MKNIYNAAKKTIALTTAVTTLSAYTPVVASDLGRDLDFDDSRATSEKVVGLEFSGNFYMKNISDIFTGKVKVGGKTLSLSYQEPTKVQGSSNDGIESLVKFNDGTIKASLPLLTKGDVNYIGVINHQYTSGQQGPQFYENVINAAKGDKESQKSVTPYVVGAVLVAGGIAALALGGGGSSNDTPATTDTTTEDTGSKKKDTKKDSGSDNSGDTTSSTPKTTPSNDTEDNSGDSGNDDESGGDI